VRDISGLVTSILLGCLPDTEEHYDNAIYRAFVIQKNLQFKRGVVDWEGTRDAVEGFFQAMATPEPEEIDETETIPGWAILEGIEGEDYTIVDGVPVAIPFPVPEAPPAPPKDPLVDNLATMFGSGGRG
jgi:hypothetical protein